jgi:hypothetical protein
MGKLAKIAHTVVGLLDKAWVLLVPSDWIRIVTSVPP